MKWKQIVFWGKWRLENLLFVLQEIFIDKYLQLAMKDVRMRRSLFMSRGDGTMKARDGSELKCVSHKYVILSRRFMKIGLFLCILLRNSYKEVF